MTRMGMQVDTGYGRIVSGLPDTFMRPNNRNPALPPVVLLHGAGGVASQMSGDVFPSIGLIADGLLDVGFTLIAVPHGIYSFGNATAKAAIDTHLSWARTNLGTPNIPPVVIGASMGGDAALSYAANNAVACAIGLIPLVDLQYALVNNVLGLRPSINAAWGRTASPNDITTLPAMSDPNAADMRAALAGKRMDLWYASDDTVSANIAGFATATGATIHSVGALGHSEAAMLAADRAAIQAYVMASL